MNIVVITDLYPAFREQSPHEISYAIHLFTRQWIKDHNVLVARPNIFPGKTCQFGRLKPSEFLIDDVPVINVPILKMPKFRLFFLDQLIEEIKKRVQPDVIVAHLGFNLLIGHKTATVFHVPLISGLHDGDFRFGIHMLSEKLLKTIYQDAAGIACRSESLFKRFADWVPELTDKCFISHSGIEEALIASQSYVDDKTNGWIQAKKTIYLTASQLIKRKHIDSNLIALANLPKDISWQYRIIGDGPEKFRLQQLAAKLEISPRVHFLGHLPRQEVIQEMRASHVFLMVSIHETFGLAYLEAMATANIVVAASGTGVDGIIRHGHNGFLCRPGDAGQLQVILDKVNLEMTAKEKSDMLTDALATVWSLTEKKAAHNYLNHVLQSISQ